MSLSFQRVAGVTYVPYVKPGILCYSEDNGQVITSPATCCQRWECLRWEGDKPFAPALVKDDRGYRVCPACKSPA